MPAVAEKWINVVRVIDVNQNKPLKLFADTVKQKVLCYF